MHLHDYLDKGTSLDPDAPALTTDGTSLSYRQVQALSRRIATGLQRSGIRAGESVAILSANDPIAFTCVFGLSRAGVVWCPINPRNEAGENRELLDLFDCAALIFQAAFAPLVAQIAPQLPRLRLLVCLDGPSELAQGLDQWLTGIDDTGRDQADRAPDPTRSPPASVAGDGDGNGDRGVSDRPADLAMIVGTGGTTGRPKGVMLTHRNLETMSAITLMSYPFAGRPIYLALAPLTHAAGVLCFPVMCKGGEIVIMRKPDIGGFLTLLQQHRVSHTFLPPTLIYALLALPDLDAADLSALQCFWYGAAPMSATRLAEALDRIGPMAQLFGQTEAPMMISTMSPAEHRRPDGSIATERLTTAGRPTPLVTVAVMDPDGTLLPQGERGEIVVRSSLVMAGYLRNPEATAEAGRHGWHHTGDIGFLDADGFLSIVDRAKDMIITGGFNVYSAEVEQAVMQHPDIQDCAVIGLPDDKWGERVTAVVQPRPGADLDPDQVRAFVKERIGSVKAPKQIEVWVDLPRSKVGKVLKTDIKKSLIPDP